jgi:Rps23 Pro-64 3,4-dihydroxylase Tpa1-like proline 4-hydroxylase
VVLHDVTDLPALIAHLDTVQQAADARVWLTDAELDGLLQLPEGTAAAAEDRLIWRNYVGQRQQIAGAGRFWTLSNQAKAPSPADERPYHPELVIRPDTAPPVAAVSRTVPNVLPDHLADQLVDYLLSHEAAFRPAATTGNLDDYRTSLVLPVFNEFQRLLHNALFPHIRASIMAFGLPRVSPIRLESYLNAYPDGTFFRLHTDCDGHAVRTRLLSFVYYVFRRPQAFSGGELVLFETRRHEGDYQARPSAVLTPQHNAVVLFPSDVPHEVRTVHVPSRTFADSRFALTGWVHAVETHAPV